MCRLESLPTRDEMRAALQASRDAMQEQATQQVLRRIGRCYSQVLKPNLAHCAGGDTQGCSAQHQASAACCLLARAARRLERPTPCRTQLVSHSAALPSGRMSLGRLLHFKLAALLPGLLPLPLPQHPGAAEVSGV